MCVLFCNLREKTKQKQTAKKKPKKAKQNSLHPL